MRQQCPACQKLVTVPESAAGTDFPCPNCNTPFAVAKGYSPSVMVPTPGTPAMSDAAPAYDKPQPPPGLVIPAATLPTAPPPLPGTPTTPTMSAPVGAPRELGVTLGGSWLNWMPAVPLTLAFLLTFFTWVAATPGGYRIFSQSAWDALSGSISTNVSGEPLVELEKTLEKSIKSNWWLLPYVILLIVTLALAWIERFVKEPNVVTLPGPLVWVVSVWHLRFAALTSLSVVLLVVLLLQCLRGFGLQHAVETVATEPFAKDIAESTGTKKKELEVKAGMEAGKLAVRTTYYLTLALLVHLVAVLGILGRLWLGKRGHAQSPRLVLRY